MAVSAPETLAVPSNGKGANRVCNCAGSMPLSVVTSCQRPVLFVLDEAGADQYPVVSSVPLASSAFKAFTVATPSCQLASACSRSKGRRC